MIPPDPNAAYELLVQARELAESPALRARLLFAMGRASQAAGNPARAIENFQAYLKEYPAGADRSRVRFQLGEAQQKANQPLPARRTWTDLARDLERSRPPSSRRKSPRSGPTRSTRSPRPTESPTRPTTPA